MTFTVLASVHTFRRYSSVSTRWDQLGHGLLLVLAHRTHHGKTRRTQLRLELRSQLKVTVQVRNLGLEVRGIPCSM